MSRLLRSYLSYARGEKKFSLWSVFYPLQFLTLGWMKLRIAMYSRGVFSVTDPALPVVSIGNNSLGGTNKTPMAELVVRQFLEAGVNAGLVSRGYRTKDHAPLWIGENEESLRRETAGDEPLMLAKRLPSVKIVVSKDRIKGVQMLADLGVQVAVTDDTFQHRKMARDVDIVLIDSTCPFGNGSVIPAGLMREPMTSFGRADIVVLTKANQVSGFDVTLIRRKLEPYVDRKKIFIADITLESWLRTTSDSSEILPPETPPQGKFIAFSAIGNPEGFYKFIEDKNIVMAAQRSYRDHHIFGTDDVEKLAVLAKELGADGLICTEKDLVNLPEHADFGLPLYIPRIAVRLDNETAFRKMILAKLKPRLMVASNGYGEDAIGVVLAKKIRDRFKAADVSAFAFVGSGTQYSRAGFKVVSPPSEMPSGGVIKYSAFALFRDIRHGLGGAMCKQLEALRALDGVYRTPVCVGDVYLLVNMLWGLGMKPVLVATAKTVYLHGHWRVERKLMRKRSRIVWTRDAGTARELRSSGVNAVYGGNPVMDLIEDEKAPDDLWRGEGEKIILLPGSRPRAYEDAKLVLNAAVELSERVKCSFAMVPAPTIDIAKLVGALEGWSVSEDEKGITSGGVYVRIYNGQVASAARDADLLIGLGGTANQLCAGLGVPVVSIIEKGKLRQKKLLREAEVLVKPDAKELAKAAERILASPDLRQEMGEAGVRRLGGMGALDKIVAYCADELGWDNRCLVYRKYGDFLKKRSQLNAGNKGAGLNG